MKNTLYFLLKTFCSVIIVSCLSLNFTNAQDECGDAPVIPSSPPTGGVELVAFSNIGATGSGTSACITGSYDIWFSYVAPADGWLLVSTCNYGASADFDTMISIFDVCAGTELACNDDFAGCGLQSEVAIPVSAGDPIIRVQSFPGTGPGSGTLAVLFAPPPTVTCMDADLVLDGMGNATLNPADVATCMTTTGNPCTFTISKTSFDCNDLGNTPVTVIATDEFGQKDTCTALVNVVDNEPPDALCMDITIALDEGCLATIGPDDIDAGSTDNCGIASRTVEPNTFGPAQIGDNMVKMTVTDVSGNSSECTSTVTVDPPPAIVLDCPTVANPIPNDPGACGATVTYAMPTATGTAATPALVSGIGGGNPNPAGGNYGDFYPVGETTDTWAVTDCFGNLVTCRVVVIVEDNEDPVVPCLPAVDIPLSGGGGVVITQFDLLNATSSSSTWTPDGSTPVPTADFSTVSTSGDVSGVSPGATILDISVDIDIAHTWVGDLTIDLVGPDGVATVNLADQPGLPVVDPFFGCDGDNIVATFNDGGAPNSGVENSDPGGCNGSIPEISGTFETAVAGGIASLVAANGGDPNGTWTLLVADGAGGDGGQINSFTVTVSFDDGMAAAGDITDNCGVQNVVLSETFFDCSNVGPNSVIMTVTDVSGNMTTCETIVTIQDVTPVQINSCPPDITYNLGPGCTGPTNEVPDFRNLPQTYDACGVIVTQDPAPGTPFSSVPGITPAHGESFTVTLTPNDPSGNGAVGGNGPGGTSCTFVITFDDAGVPVVFCPDDKNRAADANCEYVLEDFTGEAIVFDNCPLTITQDPAPGTILGPGVHTITITADDGANSPTGAPGNFCDGPNPGGAGYPNDSACEAFICGNDSFCCDIEWDGICEAAAADAGDAGEACENCTEVYFNNNSTACTFEVTVVDVTPPVGNPANCPADTVLTAAPGACSASVDYSGVVGGSGMVVTSTTDYPSGAVNLGIPAGAPGTTSGMTVSVISVSDSDVISDLNVSLNGNHSFLGDLDFFLESPSGTVVQLRASQCGVENWASAGTCGFLGGVSILTFDDEAAGTEDCLPGGGVAYSSPGPYSFIPTPDLLGAFDGENSSGNWTLTIIDNFGGDCGVLSDWSLSIESSEFILDPGALAADACGGPVAIDGVRDDGLPLADPFPSCETIITWTATDAAGNTSTICTSSVFVEIPVEDSPTAACGPPIVLGLNSACLATLDPSFLGMGISACDPDLTLTIIDLNNPPQGTLFDCEDHGMTYTYRLQVEDCSGNISICENQVTIIDQIPPTWDLPQGDLDRTFACVDEAVDYVANLPYPPVSDNCTEDDPPSSPYTLVVSVLSDTGVPGTTAERCDFVWEIVYRADDGKGNTTGTIPGWPDYPVTIMVKDSVPPVWVTGPTDLDGDFECGDEAAILANLDLVPIAQDNCGEPFVTTLDTILFDLDADGACDGPGSDRILRIRQLYSAKDSCENFVQDAMGTEILFEKNTRIIDNTPPTIDPMAMDATVECYGPSIGEMIAGVAVPQPIPTDGSYTPVAGNELDAWIANLAGADASDCSIIQFLFADLMGTDSGGDINGVNMDEEIEWTYLINPFVPDCDGTGSVVVDFTATDVCGNSSQTSATFTIEDTTDPAFVDSPSDITVECTGALDPAGALSNWLNNYGGAKAVDICNTEVADTIRDAGNNTFVPGEVTPSVVDAYIAFAYTGCNGTGSVEFFFTSTDSCGNDSTQTATFAIVDTNGPIIDPLPMDQTVNCDTLPGPLSVFTDWINDNAGAFAADDCDMGAGVTWLAEDPNGNPIDPNDPGYDPGSLFGSPFCDNGLIVTFSAIDECDNKTSATATFTIVDEEPPVVTSPPLDTLVECDGIGNLADLMTWVANHGGATATDNCNTVNWITDPPMPSGSISDLCGRTGAVTVEFIAEDICGQQTSAGSATFTIQDTTPPVFDTAPADQTVDCDATGFENQLSIWIDSNGNGGMGSDQCSGTVVWSNDYTPGSYTPGCNPPNTGTVTVEFTITDDCNLMTTSSATFTVQDTIPPTITCPDDLVVDNDMGVCGANILPNAYLTATASDACGMVTIEHSYDGGPFMAGADADAGPDGNGIYPVGTTVITFRATDVCGLTAECQTSVTVNDVEPPTIPDCPADITVNTIGTDCNQTVSWLTPNAADNCPGATITGGPVVTMGDPDIVFNIDPVSGLVIAEFSVGMTTIQYTATDVAGNSSACTFVVTVIDNDPPVINQCPPNVVFNLNSTCQPTETLVEDYTGNVDVTDNCGVIVTQSPAPGTPVSGLPANGGGTVTPAPGEAFTVVLTVEDESGNPATGGNSGGGTSCTFTVTFIDSNVPSITCPQPQTIAVGSDCDEYELPDLTGLAIVSDNCASSITVTQDPPPGTYTFDPLITPPPFNVTVTLTADDGNGNMASCNVTVTVEDQTPPILANCPANENVMAASGTCTAIVPLVPPTATDACGGVVTVVGTRDDGMPLAAPYSAGTTVVTWTATDASGNTAECITLVTVTDDVDPNALCVDDLNAGLSSLGTVTVCADDIDAGSDDDCGEDVTILIQRTDVPSSPTFCITFTCADLGDVPIQLIVEDESGNTSTCLTTVTVQDNRPPVITSCPADQLGIPNDTDECGAEVSGLVLTATDNCAALISYSVNGGTSVGPFVGTADASGFYPVGTNTIVWTVTDAAGNVPTTQPLTCTTVVEVLDVQPPTVACAQDQSVDNDPGECGATLSFSVPSLDCGSGVFTTESYELQGPSAGSAPPTAGSPTAVTLADDASTAFLPIGFSFELYQSTFTTFSIASNGYVRLATTGSATDFTCGTGYPTTNPLFSLGNAWGDWSPNNGGTIQHQTSGTPGARVLQIDYINVPEFGAADTGELTASVLIYESTNVIEFYTSEMGNTGGVAQGIQGGTGQSTFISTRNCVTPWSDLNSPWDVVRFVPNGIPQSTADLSTYCDNCPGASFEHEITFPDASSTGVVAGSINDVFFPVGISTVTWIVTDGAGNSGQCSFEVEVNDVEAPQILCQEDVEVDNDLDECGATLSLNAPVLDCSLFPDGPAPVVPPTGSPGNFCDGPNPAGAGYAPDSACEAAICGADSFCCDVSWDGICEADAAALSDPGEACYLCTEGYFNNPQPPPPPPAPNYTVEGPMASPVGLPLPIPGNATPIVYPDGSENMGPFPIGFSFEFYGNNFTEFYLSTEGIMKFTAFPSTIADASCDALPTSDPDFDNGIFLGHTSLDPTESDGGIGPGIMSYSVSGSPGSRILQVDFLEVQDDGGAAPNNANYVSVQALLYEGTNNIELYTDFQDVYNPAQTFENILQGIQGGNGSGGTWAVAIDNSGEPGGRNCDGWMTDNDLVRFLPPVVVEPDPPADPVYCENCPPVVSTYVITGATSASGTGDINGQFFGVGESTVTWTVTDDAGNDASCSFTVTVNDVQPPAITCVDGAFTSSQDNLGLYDCGYTHAGTSLDAVSTDNCPDNGIPSHDYAGGGITLDGATFPVGSTTVIWTVTDNAGNTSTCQSTIVVTDDEDPMCFAPAPVMISTGQDGDCGAYVSPALLTATADDNCGVDIITNNSPFANGPGADASGVYPLGTTTVTWFVQDFAGNISSCSTTVTVFDDEDPVVNCATPLVLPTDTDVCTADVASFVTSATDNCDLNNLAYQITDPSGAITTGMTVGDDQDLDFPGTYDLGVTLFEFTATDIFGNTSTCETTITVEDNQLPEIACPDDVAFTTGQDGTGAYDCGYTAANGELDPAFSDNCPSATIENDFNGAATLDGAVFPVGTTTVIWTVTDGSGNIATCDIVVTVTDDEGPMFDPCPATVMLDSDPGVCGAEFTFDLPDAFDNCTPVLVAMQGFDGPFVFNGHTYYVSQNTVDYATANSIAMGMGAHLATISNNAENAAIASNLTAGSGHFIGLNDIAVEGVFEWVTGEPVTFTGWNGGEPNNQGNEDATEMFPAGGWNDISVNALRHFIVEFDHLGVVVEQTGGLASGSTFPVGTTTNVFVATDEFGNSSTCEVDVVVTDVEPPVANCPDDITLGTRDDGLFVYDCAYTTISDELDPNPTDNCLVPEGVDIAWSVTGASSGSGTGSLAGFVFNLGVSTVTWTVTDVGGNTDVCSFNVTIEDDEDPVASCINFIAFSLPESGVLVIPQFVIDNTINAGSFDNCTAQGDLEFSLSQTVFTCDDVGLNNLTLTVKDEAGNTAFCTTMIEIQDNTAPECVTNDITVQLDATGNVSITVDDIDAGSTDSCGIANRAIFPDSFTCSNVGPNSVTLTLEDVNGNVSSCTATVTVQDVTPPDAVCQNITVQLNPAGFITISGAQVDGGSTDACGIGSLTVSPNFFDCGDVGDNPVTLTVTDVNGNSSICAAVVTIDDNTTPVAICQDVTIQLDANGVATVPADLIGANSIDACDQLTFSADPPTLDCSSVTNFTTEEFQALNSTVFTGNQAHLYELGMDFNVLDPNGVEITELGAFDSGSNGISGTINVAIYNRNTQSIVVGPVAVSGSGNPLNNGYRMVSIAPVTLGAGQYSVVAEGFNAFNLNGNTGVGAPTTSPATDNGGGALSISGSRFNFSGPATLSYPTSVAAGHDYHAGTFTFNTTTATGAGGVPVVITVTDGNGNSSTCSANVTVLDVTPPVAACEDITVALDANGEATVTANDVAGNSSDNCGVASIEIYESEDCKDPVSGSGAIEQGGVLMYNYSSTPFGPQPAGGSAVFANPVDNAVSAALPLGFGFNFDGTNYNSAYVSSNGFLTFQPTANSGIVPQTLPTGNYSTIIAAVWDDLNPGAGGTVTYQTTGAPGSQIFQVDWTGVPLVGGAGNVTTQILLYEGSNNVEVHTTSAPVDGLRTQGIQGPNNTVPATGRNNSTWSAASDGSVWAPFFTDGESEVVVSCPDDLTISSVVATVSGEHPDVSALTITLISPNGTEVELLAAGNECPGTVSFGLTYTDVAGGQITCPPSGTFLPEEALSAFNGESSAGDWTFRVENSGAAGNINVQLEVCGLVELPSPYTCDNVGDNPAIVVVTDVNGLTSTCAATITIIDDIPPIALCQAITVELDPVTGTASITGDDIDGGSSDNCGIDNLTVYNDMACGNPSYTGPVAIPADMDYGVSTISLDTIDPAGGSSAFGSVGDDVMSIARPIGFSFDFYGNSYTDVYISSNGFVSFDPSSDPGPLSGFPDAAFNNMIAMFVGDLDPGSGGTVTYKTTGTPGSQIFQLDFWNVPGPSGDVDFQLQLHEGSNYVEIHTYSGSSVQGVQTQNGADNASTSASGPSAVRFTPDVATGFVETTVNMGMNLIVQSVSVTDLSGNHPDVSNLNFTLTSPEGGSTSLPSSFGPSGPYGDFNGEFSAGTWTLRIDNMGFNDGTLDSWSIEICGWVEGADYSCADVGDVETLLLVTDVNGNQSTCSATVTVQDNTLPEALCQNITVSLGVAGFVTVEANQVDNGSNDACGIQSMTVNPNFFTCNDVGDNPVVLTVVDNNGNLNTCNATVTIVDDLPPDAMCSNVTLSIGSSGIVTVTAANVNANSQDPCGIDDVTVTDFATGGQPTYDCQDVNTTVQVLVTVTDNNGNTSTCVADVFIIDSVNPIAVCVQSVVLVLDNTGNGMVTAADIDNGSSDNCELQLVQISGIGQGPGNAVLFDCDNVGLNTVVLRVTDASGNVNTCAAEVDVIDGTAPTALCQNFTTTIGPNGTATVDPSDVDNGSFDECCLGSLTLSQTTFNAPGQYPVVLTVEDCSGNASSCTATVTVNPSTTINFCPTVFLQGSFNPSTNAPSNRMRTSLNQNGVIPLAQPYNVAPWNYGGPESLASIPVDMVDWVLLVVRDGANPAVVLARAAGVLHTDGKVSDTNGNNISLAVSSASGYYMEIMHRNHLPITSSASIQPDGAGSVCWDFTTDMEQAFRNVTLNDDPQQAMNSVSGLFFGMNGGNVQNADLQIDANDINLLFQSYLQSGYKSADVNMDNVVDANDINLLFGNYNDNAHTPY